MRVVVLASGSAGNSSFYESRGTRVLVDAGLGPRTVHRMLEEAGHAVPHALIVTHAHHDHVRHADAIGRHLSIPVYMTHATSRATVVSSEVRVCHFDARRQFSIGALTITPLPLPHDAAQVALTISDGSRSASLVTDLGEVPRTIPAHIADSDVLLVESNYDATMLDRGPYPEFLKARIRSARGHLDNQQTHALLRRLSKRTHTVVLMHLSETNNRRDVAYAAACDALRGCEARVLVAPPRGPLTVDAGFDPRPMRARPAPCKQLQLAF